MPSALQDLPPRTVWRKQMRWLWMGRLCFFCPALCPAGILYAMLSLQPHKLMWSRTSERKKYRRFLQSNVAQNHCASSSKLFYFWTWWLLLVGTRIRLFIHSEALKDTARQKKVLVVINMICVRGKVNLYSNRMALFGGIEIDLATSLSKPGVLSSYAVK